MGLFHFEQIKSTPKCLRGVLGSPLVLAAEVWERQFRINSSHP